MTERRPLGNVLVATDFSGAATRAAERAGRLPMAPGSVLTVLHVLRPGSAPEDRADGERGLAHAASVATAALARAGRTNVGVSPCLVEGTPYVEIASQARHDRRELVVVGRHGERTFRDLMLGSTAERVVRTSEVSTLVVGSYSATGYERPVVAVDCADQSRCAVELAWRLADPSVRALEVVHAYEPVPASALRRAGVFGEAARQYRLEAERRAEGAVEAFLAAGPATPASLVVREGDARRVILDVGAEHDADLLALGTHGRSGLAHALLGSVAEAVVRAASCDVLVARTG